MHAWLEDSTREKLLRLMGLAQEQSNLRLPQTLPELPRTTEDLPDVEQVVLQNRIDLRLLRMRVDELAHNLGLTKATRYINVLDIGPARILQGTQSQPYEHGYQVSLEIPVFDGGGPRLRRAEALYAQAVDRFTQAAVDARSQIRVAYAAYRAAFDIARQQRDEVMPAAKRVAAQNLLRYNASLISLFDLLADAGSQITSVDAGIQSVRDFWTAKSQLDAALLGEPHPEIREEIMITRRGFFGGAGASGGSRRSRQERAGGAPATGDHRLGRDAQALGAAEWPSLSSRGDLERLEPALAHAPRNQGISSGRGARDS